MSALIDLVDVFIWLNIKLFIIIYNVDLSPNKKNVFSVRGCHNHLIDIPDGEWIDPVDGTCAQSEPFSVANISVALSNLLHVSSNIWQYPQNSWFPFFILNMHFSKVMRSVTNAHRAAITFISSNLWNCSH